MLDAQDTEPSGLKLAFNMLPLKTHTVIPSGPSLDLCYVTEFLVLLYDNNA